PSPARCPRFPYTTLFRSLAERGIGFKSVAEAIELRNRVLAAMDAAESTDDERIRRSALTFVFVGGGYAGIEAMAGLEDMARSASDRKSTRLNSSHGSSSY